MKFVLKCEITFEVDQKLGKDVQTFKESMNNGSTDIVDFNMSLVYENGKTYKNKEDLKAIQDAIIYGLLERV